MATFLQGQIKALTAAVAREDIPSALRRAPTPARKRKKASKKTTARKPAKRKPAKKSGSAKKAGAKKRSAKKAGAKR